MSETDRPALSGMARVAALGAILLAVLAGTLFIVVIVLGSGGATNVADLFGPIAIGVTSLGVVVAVYAIVLRRSRVLGITALLVLLPSIVLSLLTVVALNSQ